MDHQTVGVLDENGKVVLCYVGLRDKREHDAFFLPTEGGDHRYVYIAGYSKVNGYLFGDRITYLDAKETSELIDLGETQFVFDVHRNEKSTLTLVDHRNFPKYLQPKEPKDRNGLRKGVMLFGAPVYFHGFTTHNLHNLSKTMVIVERIDGTVALMEMEHFRFGWVDAKK